MFRKSAAPVAVEPSTEELAVISRVMRHYPDGSKPTFGAPLRCVGCGDFALVDGVWAPGIAEHSCYSCGATFTVTRAALRAWQPPTAAPAGVGAGLLGNVPGDERERSEPTPVEPYAWPEPEWPPAAARDAAQDRPAPATPGPRVLVGRRAGRLSPA